MKTRRGWSYTVKITLWTDSIKDEDEDYCFNKVEGFVGFEPDPYLRIKQLQRQIHRKIEFYEKLFKIKVTNYDFNILADIEIEFLPTLPMKRRKYEQTM